MAFKTITLDLEAYETLRRLKRPGDSFSDVVKSRLRGGLTAGELLERARSSRVSVEALDAIEREITRRRRSPARAARLSRRWIC